MATSDGLPSDQQRSRCCFLEWMRLQESDLAELLEALSLRDDPGDRHRRQLIGRNIEHFEEYIGKRRSLSQEDVAGFFAPAWNTAIENSMMWLAGCRPSIFVRLVYVLCGAEVEASLSEFVEGARMGNLGELTASQLAGINALQIDPTMHLTKHIYCMQGRTIGEEEKLTSRMASLQEKIADQPIVAIARRTNQGVEPGSEADAALDECEREMLAIMGDADRLRLNTLKEMVGALTPPQAVDFLVASKKLHLCIHEWGKRRNHKHGRD
ncbi:protein DOG1-like 3 [Rhodamnia argentea]|uniref:Protein DOG1-like 3 n=1 Tax=Rhodamnia argentea TaxID=178133 RepID=A0ABM3HVY5_9MYRT|nr:protein DOG1-like 3 [Rhodamnia argentea]